MFERFTERARQVVVLGQQEARDTDCAYIGAEHILVGILREEEGLAARVLTSLGVKLDDVREAIKLKGPIGPRPEDKGTDKGGQIPFTPRAKQCLELALREALSLGHNYIGTEHILLGLLRNGENTATEILFEDNDLDADKVRNEVIRMLSGPKAPVITKDPKDYPVRNVPPKISIDPVDLDDLLNLAIALGRQHPDVSTKQVIAAAKALAF